MSPEDGVALLLYGFLDAVQPDLTLVVGNGEGGVRYRYLYILHSDEGADRTFETRLAVVAVDFWNEENLLHGSEITLASHNCMQTERAPIGIGALGCLAQDGEGEKTRRVPEFFRRPAGP